MVARRRLLDFIYGKIPATLEIGDTLFWDGSDFVVGRRGGGPGTPGPLQIVGPFPIAYDTPGLYDPPGVALHTPVIGDCLVDVWVQINEAWDSAGELRLGTFQGDDVALASSYDVVSSAVDTVGDFTKIHHSFAILTAFIWNASTPVCVRMDVSEDLPTQGSADLYVVTATPTIP